jgi:hypothetical protein
MKISIFISFSLIIEMFAQCIESIKGKLTHILGCDTHDTFCIP